MLLTISNLKVIGIVVLINSITISVTLNDEWKVNLSGLSHLIDNNGKYILSTDTVNAAVFGVKADYNGQTGSDKL